jgi:hypothetical protein
MLLTLKLKGQEVDRTLTAAFGIVALINMLFLTWYLRKLR